MHKKLISLLGATYDSIEGRFRIIKREAAILRAEIEQGERPEAPPRGGAAVKLEPSGESFSESAGGKVTTPRKPRTPKKTAIKHEDDSRVLTGRVSKNTKSPKKTSKAVKEEVLGEESIFGYGEETQKDLEDDPLMESLGQVDFDHVLHYEGI